MASPSGSAFTWGILPGPSLPAATSPLACGMQVYMPPGITVNAALCFPACTHTNTQVHALTPRTQVYAFTIQRKDRMFTETGEKETFTSFARPATLIITVANHAHDVMSSRNRDSL